MSILSSIRGRVYEAVVELSDCWQAARDGREYARDRLAHGGSGPIAWPLDTYIADGHAPCVALHLTRIFNRAALARLCAE